MPKKKTTKKTVTIKRVKKVMTVELPKAKAPEDPSKVVASLKQLQASSGWAVIVRILNENIAYLERAILSKIDPLTKQDLTDEEVDTFRTKLGLNIDVRDTPKNYATVITDTGDVPDDYDPYYKTNEEIKLAEKRQSQRDKDGEG